MNERELLNEIQADLQKASFVLYLEGKTDPEPLFALLGVPQPKSGIHQDVYVRGLRRTSGGSSVRFRIDVAQRNGLGLTPSGGVAGVIDGDGRDLQTLASEFDAPYVGPLFSWKSYCIENLLAKAEWPSAWPQPNWRQVLAGYSPYAGLNRIHRELQKDLETLGLARFTNPQVGQPLLTVNEVRSALSHDKHLMTTRDVETDFANALTVIDAAINASLDQGHTMINGKWLVRDHACRVTGHGEDDCRSKWANAVRAAGGLPEVRDLWQRITGSAP